MPRRYLRPSPAPGRLAEDFARIRAEFDVTVPFPAEAQREADRIAARPPAGTGRADRRDLPFVTLDPAGSRDLDQAMHLERRDGGYLVSYAIADVGSAIGASTPALQDEAWLRGQTVYCPDVRAPVYPGTLSEGALSLLPGEPRPAVLFRIELDGDGNAGKAAVERAMVESREQLAYGQREVPYLEEIGTLRRRLAEQRGAVMLRTPAQRVAPDPAEPCGYRLELEPRLPDEDWNAEISLLANMAAADMMAAAGIGLLRTMAGPDDYQVRRLRRAVAGLGVDWPEDEPLAAFANRLDPEQPLQAALLEEVHDAMGHAEYRFFEGPPPADAVHAGIGARYAHATAPLRRLADRYVLDALLGAADADALARLPEVMARCGGRASRVERAVVDLMETRVLEHRVGERFAATVLDTDKRGAIIQITDPPVRARLHADPLPEPGTAAEVELARADPRSRSLEFRPVPGTPPGTAPGAPPGAVPGDGGGGRGRA